MSEHPSGARTELRWESAEQAAADLARLRSLTLEERGDLIVAACRLARLIASGRAESGLPPARPAPWPASTLEFLRRHAPNARTR